MTTPERPEQIPANATFNSEMALWEIVERDDAGRLHGAFTAFRDDGSVLARGTYAHGEFDGLLSRYSDGTPGSAALRPCCVPPGAREIRARYSVGRLLEEIFYDGEGRPLCEDGTPWPERRGAVPPDARFDETNRRYVTRLEHGAGSTTFRYYDADGVVADELDATAGQARAHRRFFPDGTLAERTSIDENGHKDGEYFARFMPNASPYQDARIAEVRGQYEHGEPVGNWEHADAAGGLVKRVEFGAPLGPREMALVAGRDPDGEPHGDPCSKLGQAGPRARIALAARVLAKSADPDAFARVVELTAAVLRPEIATARANEVALAKGTTMSSLLGAVIAGAEPAILLRTLASSLDGNAPAALDYFDASQKLAPDQAMAAMARALLCIEQGEPEGALAAASLAETESPEAARSLREFTRVTYGPFPFRPQTEGVAPPEEELVEVEAQQPLDAVLGVLELYATRLLVLRRELERRSQLSVRPPSWLPPDTSALLPQGPKTLGRRTARIEDEGENGPEVSEVAIDETVPLERSTRSLLGVARADWAALCWLCWAAGLDEVVRPERLVARPDFAAAAHQATVRCWRAHDRLRLAGLVALARQVASFDWEGMPIDAVPPHLIEFAAAEYLEVRAVFFWLLFPQNESPFQSDLRRV